MKTNPLALNCNELKIAEAPEPQEVLLPLWGIDSKERLKIKAGTPISTGEPLIPGVFSTVTGTIKGVEPLLPVHLGKETGNGSIMAVRITVAEKEKWDEAVKKDPQFLEKEPAELLEKLNRANLGFGEDITAFKEVKAVIIGAVDPDPFQCVALQILREAKEIVSEGIKLVRYLTSAQKVILAIPEPFASLAAGVVQNQNGVLVHQVKPLYPNGLPEILARETARLYQLDNPLYITVEKLVAAVNALREGKSFAHKVVTVIDSEGAANYRVRIGTPLKNLLALKSCYLKDDDKVILGGPMRGKTCFNTEIPITEDIDSVYVQHADAPDAARYWNNQCMNCGRCVKVCPVNLDVNLICRYSEFSLFEECHDMGVMICIECGLCAYNCPSGRSLVQYIRLAKNQKKTSEMEKE